MAKRVKKKIKRTAENTGVNTGGKGTELQEEANIIESAEALQEQIGRSQAFIESNSKLLSSIAVGIVAVIALIFAWNQYSSSMEMDAQAELSPAVFFFEKDSLDKAINGDDNTTMGLLGVVEEYGSSKAADLAHYYLGVAYLKQAKFSEAIEELKAFGGGDDLVQARTYSLIGDAYMEQKEYDEAVRYYQKASKQGPNEQFTPAYLMKLALATIKNGDEEGGKAVYGQIVKEYPTSNVVNDAKKLMEL